MQEKGQEGCHGTWDDSVGFTETVRVSPVQPKGEEISFWDIQVCLGLCSQAAGNRPFESRAQLEVPRIVRQRVSKLPGLGMPGV